MFQDNGSSLLLAALLALWAGPCLYSLGGRGAPLRDLLDGLVFVAVSGLLLLLILPQTVLANGWWAVSAAVVGFLGPWFLEHFPRWRRPTHSATLALGLTGICLHAVADGMALSNPTVGTSHALAVAVVLHRLPVGLGIWWLMRPCTVSRRLGVLAVATAGTLAGFFGVSFLSRISDQAYTGTLQALVAGSLFHVVLHRPGETRSADSPRPIWFQGAGSLFGIALLAQIVGSQHDSQAAAGLTRVFVVLQNLAFRSAPALLLGYLLAGLISVFLTASSLRWLARGSALSQSAKGVLAGLPVPICSCGVMPLYRSLVLRGAPAAVGFSFLVATPELGIDAVFLSLPLLGTRMTLARVAAATGVALFMGWLMGTLAKGDSRRDSPLPDVEKAAPSESVGRRLRKGLHMGLIDLVDHTGPWILLGLLVAALAEPLLQDSSLTGIPGLLGVVTFALLGLPTYVCASGATPLVAILMAHGLSPGAALAFLLTGPATNVSTFGILSALHGRRVAFLFSLGIIAASIGVGCLTNLLLPELVVSLGAVEETPSALEQLSLLIVATLMAFSVLRRGARGFVGEIWET